MPFIPTSIFRSKGKGGIGYSGIAGRIELDGEDMNAPDLDVIRLRRRVGMVFQKYDTVIIVIHNMQQAARISEYTAFMYLGKLMEFDRTNKMFTSPEKRQTQDYITGRFG